jgi:hypothetical protein
MSAPYRTYQVGGDFISVDLALTPPPTHYDKSWEITLEAYSELYAHSIPAIYPDETMGVNEDIFPPYQEP